MLCSNVKNLNNIGAIKKSLFLQQQVLTMSLIKVFISIFLAIIINLVVFSDVSQENISNIDNSFNTNHIFNYAFVDSNSPQIENFEYRMERFMKYWNIQGASVAIAKDGEIVYERGFGMADTVNKIPVEPTHMFRVASVSKLITAVAIMRLVEDGKLSLDDYVFGENGVLNMAPFDKYKDKKVERIKVKHLLEHSGGWTLYYGDPMFHQYFISKKLGINRPLTSKEVIAYMLQKRLHFNPGDASHYSNLGYTILGEVVEACSGISYETYVRSNILSPLGITDMHLGKNRQEDWLPNEVCYYEQPDALEVPSAYDHTVLARKCDGGKNLEALGAAGQWISSPESLLKLVMTIDGDAKPFDILKKETIEEMTYARTNGYSPYGWRKTRSNGEWVRTGTLAGSTCLINKAPDGFTYVVLCNTSPWKGSEFPFIMKRFMDKQTAKVDCFTGKES